MTTEATPELTVNLAEFDKLRQEIDNRTTLGSQVVALELTAVGAAVAVAAAVPDALLGLAAVTCCLWLLWLDHAVQVYKIASYIGVQLAPRVSQNVGEPVLRWESYLRTLDAGGLASWRALFPSGSHDQRSDSPVTETRSVASYVTLLFGGIPVVAISIYVVLVAERFGTEGEVIRYASVALVAVLWIASLIRYRQFQAASGHIVDALLESRSVDNRLRGHARPQDS
jgi:hypothetical protein